MREGRTRSALLGAVLVMVLGCANAARNNRDKAPVSRDDIKYIKCSVCQNIAKNLAREVKRMREEKGPKLKEIHILETVEQFCNPDKEAGSWIPKIDLVETGSELRLVEQPKAGVCGTECRTVAKACEDTLGLHDTDVAESLFELASGVDGKAMQRAQLEQLLCRELTTACRRPPPPLPEGRPPGPAFAEKNEGDEEFDRLMASMGDTAGMGKMSLYSREELLREQAEGLYDEDADEDDMADAMADLDGGEGVQEELRRRPGSGGPGKMAPQPRVTEWEAAARRAAAAGAEAAQRAATAWGKGVRAAAAWAGRLLSGGDKAKGGEL